MNYRSWEDQVPEATKRDSVWNSKAYRLALFAADLSWHDPGAVIKLLLTMVPNQRGAVLKEDSLGYYAAPPTQTRNQSIDAEELLNLVPIP